MLKQTKKTIKKVKITVGVAWMSSITKSSITINLEKNKFRLLWYLTGTKVR